MKTIAELNEIRERGLQYSEKESYTDDFHENLLIALLAVQNDYEQYFENMKLIRPLFYIKEKVEHLNMVFPLLNYTNRNCIILSVQSFMQLNYCQ